MLSITGIIIGLIVGLAITGVCTAIFYQAKIKSQINDIKIKKEDLLLKEEKIKVETESFQKEAVLQAREEAVKLRAEIDKENKEKKAELAKTERRLTQKELTLDKRAENLDQKEKNIQKLESKVQEKLKEADKHIEEQVAELHRISNLSAEEAKELVISKTEQEMERHVARIIRQAEEEAYDTAQKKAQSIVVTAIQKCAVDQTAESTVSTVSIPSEEMKGRIIGREGRNIRTFETQTGVDLIIDDTPEAVVISGFDPVRREIARVALTNLIVDGRIHPGRIEETIEKAKKEVEQKMKEAAEKAIFETGVTGLNHEIIKLLGRLRYRSSYGQNVLQHSVEVSLLAGTIASELDLNVNLAKRAGLLHDLGKAVDFEIEKPHAVISMDLLLKYKENSKVAEACGAHHYDIEPTSPEAVIIQASDAISASRPGARRETLETYVKRLAKLEEIANSYPGVEKTYAVQAGREIRVMVKPTEVNDELASKLAYETAKKIEEEMEYPGQIKVTVIRETRSVEYAK